jgi:uncharacterized membrane protein YhdT
MDFYSVKGVFALVAVVLLFVHMRQIRGQVNSLGQWLRYLTLLYVAVLMTGTSLDQFTSDAPINWYNIAAIGFPVLLIVTMVVSIRESRDR